MVIQKFIKRYIVGILFVLIVTTVSRFFLESRMSGISNRQIRAYCEENKLPFTNFENNKRREMGLFRSIYDYTISGSETHRIRFYITVFGQSERHTLVE